MLYLGYWYVVFEFWFCFCFLLMRRSPTRSTRTDRLLPYATLCRSCFCVGGSAVDGRREGFEVVVLEGACGAIDLDGLLGRARREMAAAGAVLAVSDTLRG